MRKTSLHNRKAGSALLVTLGLLAVASALIFAFALSARTERLASRRAKEGMEASEHLETALGIVMAQHLPYYLQEINFKGNFHYLSSGRTSRFDRWGNYFSNTEKYHRPSIATSYGNDPDYETATNFLSGPVTNYIPAALHDQMEDCQADWIPIEIIDENSPGNNVIATNAQLAYAIIDLSGFLDACMITSNQVAWLENAETDIADARLFIEDRARHTAPGENGMPAQNGYVTYRDLVLRNRGLSDVPGYLLHYSFDPAPDVTSTGVVVYGSNLYGNQYAGYLPKFDLNSWTNDFGYDLDDTDKLATYYATNRFRKGWLQPVKERLSACGFAAAKEIAWNLVNFMDGDRIPQGPNGKVQWREDWPVEDVPLINEIAVAQVPPSFGKKGEVETDTDYTNCYATAAELWFPFVPNAITNSDHAEFVMAVYTNWPSKKDSDILAKQDWTDPENIPLAQDSEYGFTVTYKIEEMRYGSTNEYLVFTLPPEKYISFPVTVTNFSKTGTGPLYGPKEDGTLDEMEWKSDSGDPPDDDERYRTEATFNLPLGIQSYSTFVKISDTPETWRRQDVTVTNEIRLITRVKVKGQWVDEAMAFDPNDPDFNTCHEDTDGPYPFREPCGFEVNDPRRNGRFEDWSFYKGGDRTPVAEGQPGGAMDRCTLSGTTNSICDPWHEYGQGLPIVHYDAPLRRAGDIGYIYEPYSKRLHEGNSHRPYDNDAIQTNFWQSICLADKRIQNITNSYSLSAGSVLEFFTVRNATNAPVRGLVNVNTPWPVVVQALAADIKVGTGMNFARFDDKGIEWVTNVFFDIQQKIFDSESIPVGVGDFCMGAGLVDSYYSADAIRETDDSLHWRNSWGSDSKEDVLRELCERISFRQQIYGVYLVARATTPAMTIGAERKALAIVLRDAYTGSWRILNWIDL